MEKEVEGEGAKVEEGRYQSPVLSTNVVSFPCLASFTYQASYLILHKHSPEAVEELEWCDDMTLNED